MRRYRLLMVAALAAVSGLLLGGPWLDTAATQTPVAANRAAVDLTPKALDPIPVGTVIENGAPMGWSHLVLFATPKLTAEDLKEAPRTAASYAQLFKFTVLANVVRSQGNPAFVLEKVGRGFATTINGKETVINASNTKGASLGLFGRQILDENERILDNDVRQIVRTPTMLIFDAQAVVRQNDQHMPMVVRHAIVADPQSGKLAMFVWLLNKDYQAVEEGIQCLPNGMREDRFLSVKRDQFTLGIPSREAFALRRIPQGTPIRYDDKLKSVATVREFTVQSAQEAESVLRATAAKVQGK